MYLVMCDSFRPFGLYSTRFLCPWDFSGKNIGMGCPFLLQGISQIEGLKQHLLYLLHCKAFFTHWAIREYFNVFRSAAAAKLLQSCPTLCDPIERTRLPRPWDSPGKNINGASQEALVVKNQSANVGHIRDGFETWVGKIP